jgi:hypothetical protein
MTNTVIFKDKYYPEFCHFKRWNSQIWLTFLRILLSCARHWGGTSTLPHESERSLIIRRSLGLELHV